MEKRTEKRPVGFLHNRWLLFFISLFTLTASYWLKTWPLMAFIGLIPCFAFTDSKDASKHLIEVSEFLLFAFGISLFIGYRFNLNYIFSIAGLAALYSIPFLLFILIRKGAGQLTGHFLIILFWLAGEYFMLKILIYLNWLPTTNPVFLADMLISRPDWFSWNTHSGYLSVSAWILVSNWLGYRMIAQSFHWSGILLFVVVLFGPVIFGLWYGSVSIGRSEMIELYSSVNVQGEGYTLHGEWVGRTAAWVSVLILIFSLIQHKTRKR